ncbi:MAG: hypothetical protein K0R68_1585, partial [Mycobacterium sp.]|nr:hypothetical protein [Mycobacterium sp.]
MAVAAGMAVAGCSHTVGGSAQLAAPEAVEAGRNFGYIDNSCGRLADSTVQETIEADDIVRPYSGAVCQYVLSRGDSIVDATFSWFESGSLERERALADERGAEITDTVVER